MEKKKVQATPYHINPRQITDKQLLELEVSMAKHGDLSGIVVNIRTGQIVGGNQRSKIIDLQNATIELVEQYKQPDYQGTVAWGYVTWKGARYNYREVSWKPEQEKAANVLANKLGGTWDMAILEQHWSKEELLQLGWKKGELKWHNDPGSFTDPENLPPAASQIHTKKGDLYQLNEHKLLCGDATKGNDVTKLLGNQQADIIITDPPYNVDYQAKAGKIANDKMPDDQFRLFLASFYHQATAAAKPGAPWYIFHADSKGHIFRDEFIKAGNYLSQCLIWIKDQLVLGRSDYHWQHEPILYGCAPGETEALHLAEILSEQTGLPPEYYLENHMPVLYGWVRGGKHPWHTNRSQSTTLQFDRPKHSAEHPTMKPVALIEYLLNNSSEPGELAVDYFSGLGSTLIAADKSGRLFAGIDIAPHFIDRTIRRWVQYRKDSNQEFVVRKNGKDITKQQWIHG